MISPAAAMARPAPALLVVAEGKLPALGRLTAPMIVVEDVLAALDKLGVAARARSQAKIIAVTGSVGKTSTKEALRHALSRRRQGACLGRSPSTITGACR